MTRVRVVCRADSHAQKIAIVTEFVTVGGRWEESPSAGRPVRAPRQLTGVTLADDEPIAAIEALERRDEVRVAYKLRCPLCGLDVHLRREKAVQMLDGLVAAGVSDISLEALAASVSG